MNSANNLLTWLRRSYFDLVCIIFGCVGVVISTTMTIPFQEYGILLVSIFLIILSVRHLIGDIKINDTIQKESTK